MSSQGAVGSGRAGFRLATWNVQWCRRGLDRAAALIRSLEADVVALQEVDCRTRRSGRVHQADALSASTGLPYRRFFRAIGREEGDYGLALLSRYPLDGLRVGLLPADPDTEPRIHVSARCELPAGAVEIHVTHLTHRATSLSLRLRQAEAIARRLREGSLPQVLVGDLNSVPGEPPQRLLTSLLTDVFEACGRGPAGTYPLLFGLLPAMRIDYVLASSQLQPIQSRVVPTDASDHYALFAELRLAASDATATAGSG